MLVGADVVHADAGRVESAAVLCAAAVAAVAIVDLVLTMNMRADRGAAAFAAMVKDKLSTPAVPVIVENIAVAGSMASDWSKREYLDGLTEHAKNADYVWITLMGNDCAAYMPGCARRGGSPASCGAR